MKFEPILITQLVASALTLMVAFGLPVTDEQRQAILQFTGVVVAIFLGSGLVARSVAWSPASVEQEADLSWESGYAVGYREGMDDGRKTTEVAV